jgi:PhnB protein
MPLPYKPEGHNSVSPYFVVPEHDRFIKMIETIFGGELLRRYDREDGSLMHAEMRIDDSVIMFGGQMSNTSRITCLFTCM